MQYRSAVLSVTFVPDDSELAIITAHTIPEKRAYQVCLKGLGPLNKYGDSFEAKGRRLEEIIFDRARELKRDPNVDYDDHPIAPIQQMFKDGFYETNWTLYFYAGMGHFGQFIGVFEGVIELDRMTLLRKVDNELIENKKENQR